MIATMLETKPVLTALDRCDADCPAAARVQCFDIDDNRLDFCGHHFEKHEASLIGWAVVINDERRFDGQSSTNQVQ